MKEEPHRLLRVEKLEDRRMLAAADLVISEFMATNVTTLPGYYSDYPDWIEIHNQGTTAVNLSDYSLTDNDSNLQKWTFPSTVLPGGGYTYVFASEPLDSNGDPISGYVDPGGVPHANFKVGSDGEYLALTYEDPSTHAVSIVHEYAPEFPEQYPDYSFGIASGGATTYFDAPTPGYANGAGLLGVVADTTFSVDRGFYDTPFQLTINTATPGAAIYYTTDGSAPSDTHGTLYTGPLTIDHTSVVRAIAMKADYVPTNIDTQTYLFLNDVVNQTEASVRALGYPDIWHASNGDYTADYGLDPDVIGTFDSNGNPLGGDLYGGVYAAQLQDSLLAIPTISIVLDPDDMFGQNWWEPEGIYIDPRDGVNPEPERATSVEWITTDGSAEFQVDSGIQMSGGAFRSQYFTLKHSFRLVFKDEYGPTELEFPLFGEGAVDEYNTVVLKATANDGYSWRSSQPSTSPATLQYLRDQFGHSLQQDMGYASSHDAYAHLYINGVYWGLYYAQERPDAEFAESYLGVNPDKWDAIHDDEANSGDFDAWYQMLNKSYTAGSSLTDYMELQGLNNDGTPNPSIAPLLDVENYIDYLIVNVWAGCDDWPHHNFWAGRDRDPDTTEGFQFFLWDFDSGMHVNEKWSPLDTKTFDQGFTGTYNVGQAHDYLQWNPEYQLAFADHVHKWFFNDGILTTDSLIARYQEISDRVEEMMVAESARWGDMNSPTPTPIVLTDWQYERDYMLNTYLPQRSDIVMQEMREYGFYPDTDAPVFSQHGGQVESGYDLSITAPTGTIYYTLDGSDPRLVGGSVSPTALVYTGATVDITAGMTVKARVLSGSEWSALNEAAFTIAPPAAAGNFAITELNYNPHGPNPVAGMGELDVDSNEFEFIELTNTGAETIDLTGVTIAGGVTYAFTAQTLDPGQSVLVVENQAAFESRFGTSLNVAGQYGGKLSNGGEPLTLLDTFGQQILSFEYSDGDGWPERADGDGSSLEVVDTSGDYDDPLNWRASADYGGSPGTVGVGPQADVFFNELLTHSDGASPDKVELYNASGVAVDLDGWYLSDDPSDITKFQFTGTTTLAAGGYLVLSQSQLGFALDGQNGESIWLIEADPATGFPLRIADSVVFDASATDVSLGRWLSGDPSGTLFPTSVQSFGSQNASPLLDDVLITELHYNPADVPPAEQANISQAELEFAELTNFGTSARDIGNWTIDGIGYAFPPGTSILPGESIVVVTFDPAAEPSKATAFRNVFSVAAGVRLFGAAGGKLDNSGERVSLLRPEDPVGLTTGDILVDTLRYDELAPWPATADGNGDSLNRYDASAFGEFVENWLADTPTPGAFTAAPAGDFDSDSDVDIFDLMAWQRGFGSTSAMRADGDATGDGTVDSADLTAWQTSFSQSEIQAPAPATAPLVAAVQVPTPQQETPPQFDAALAYSHLNDGPELDTPTTPQPTSTPAEAFDAAIALNEADPMAPATESLDLLSQSSPQQEEELDLALADEIVAAIL